MEDDQTVCQVVWGSKGGVAGMRRRLDIIGNHNDKLTDRDLLSPSENRPADPLVTSFDLSVQWLLAALSPWTM